MLPCFKDDNLEVFDLADHPDEQKKPPDCRTPPGHFYQIHSFLPSKEGNPHIVGEISFQCGGLAEVGVNGVGNISVLAVVRDSIEKLNKQFPCRENAITLTKLDEAIMWLERRRSDRIARGVEGKRQA